MGEHDVSQESSELIVGEIKANLKVCGRTLTSGISCRRDPVHASSPGWQCGTFFCCRVQGVIFS